MRRVRRRSQERSGGESATLFLNLQCYVFILARVRVPGNLCYTRAHAELDFSIRNRCVYDCRVDYFRSEEHTSELQSLTNLVCRLLLEKKNNKNTLANNNQKHLTYQSHNN